MKTECQCYQMNKDLNLIFSKQCQICEEIIICQKNLKAPSKELILNKYFTKSEIIENEKRC